MIIDIHGHYTTVFASELIDAVRGIDPETGHDLDDTRYVEAAHIDPQQRHKMIYEANGASIRASTRH